MKEVLTYIEKEDVLPPIVVLHTLSKNPCLMLSVVKDYIARKLEQESKLIEDDRKSMNKYQVSNSIVISSAAFSLCCYSQHFGKYLCKGISIKNSLVWCKCNIKKAFPYMLLDVLQKGQVKEILGKLFRLSVLSFLFKLLSLLSRCCCLKVVLVICFLVVLFSVLFLETKYSVLFMC